MVNFVKQVRAVMYKLEADSRIRAHHVSLYWALFQTWNEHRFQSPMRIYRDEIMKRAKIHSRKTYAKCMRELAKWNYFLYDPGVHHFEPCLVLMRRLDGGKLPDGIAVHDHQGEPGDNLQSGSTCDTMDDPNDSPNRDPNSNPNDDPNHDPHHDTHNINSINNTNIQNHENENKHAHPLSNFNCDFARPVQASDAEEKNGARGAGDRATGFPVGNKPEPRPASLYDVYSFFASLNSTRTEAEQFFHYYNSNGWKVGGRSDMRDWRESARGWLLKAKRFNSPSGPRPGSLASPGPQHYAEPL